MGTLLLAHPLFWLDLLYSFPKRFYCVLWSSGHIISNILLFAITETHLPLKDIDISQPSIEAVSFFLLTFHHNRVWRWWPVILMAYDCFLTFALSSLSYSTSSFFRRQATRICLLSYLVAVTHCLSGHSPFFVEDLLSGSLPFFPSLFLSLFLRTSAFIWTVHLTLWPLNSLTSLQPIICSPTLPQLPPPMPVF